MPAGASAGDEHQRSLALADAHEREAHLARQRAGRMKVASDTERRTAGRLDAPQDIGRIARFFGPVMPTE